MVLSLGKLVLEGLMALGLLASALWLSPRLTLWALAALPLTVLLIVLLARSALRRSYSVRRTGYVLFDVILQMMRGIRVIKAYRGEEAEARTALEMGRAYFDDMYVRGLHGPLNNLNAAYVEIRRRGASVSRIAELLDT